MPLKKAATTIGSAADQIVNTSTEGVKRAGRETGKAVESGVGFLGDIFSSARNTLKLGGGRSRRRSKSRKSRHNRRRTRHSRRRRSSSRRRRSHTRRRR